jgi:hypothetical protein
VWRLRVAVLIAVAIAGEGVVYLEGVATWEGDVVARGAVEERRGTGRIVGSVV